MFIFLLKVPWHIFAASSSYPGRQSQVGAGPLYGSVLHVKQPY